MKHIVITGQRGAGKSTLIRRLLAANSRPVSGFVTQKGPLNKEGLYPVHIYPAADAARIPNAENCVGFRGRKVCRVNAEVFDSLGVAYLGAEDDGLIVMDELGVMETCAEVFMQAVMRTLDGEIPVIAVVKARFDVDFPNAVRSHPNVLVYEITEENRDALYEELLPVIREWNRM